MSKAKKEKIDYKEIIKEFKRTKSQALFAIIYKRYYYGLYSHIYKMIQDVDVVKDIVSETFSIVYNRIDEYDENYQLSTWMYNIGYYIAIAWYRGRKVTIPFSRLASGDKTFGEHDEDYREKSGRGKTENPLDVLHFLENAGAENPLSLEEKDELLQIQFTRVLDIIYSMKEPYKSVMIYRFIDKLSYEEIENKFNAELQVKIDSMKKVIASVTDTNSLQALKKSLAKLEKSFLNLSSVKNRIHGGRNLLKRELAESREFSYWVK